MKNKSAQKEMLKCVKTVRNKKMKREQKRRKFNIVYYI